jgi:hypothetical protein
LNKKLDEAREEADSAKDGTIAPIEDAAYCDKKENENYWDELGNSPAAKDFKKYVKEVKCALPILQKEAIIRGGETGRTCPYGLSIPGACRNAGTTVDQMTALIDVGPDEREKYARLNRRVYAVSFTGERCKYADRVIENSDKVNCDFSDTGQGEREWAQPANPKYPSQFNGLQQPGLYSMPASSYSDWPNAQESFFNVWLTANTIPENSIEKQGDTHTGVDQPTSESTINKEENNQE